MNELLGLPAAASEHAAGIDNMMAVIHVIMLLLFLGWGIYFLYVLFRFRQSRNPKASYTGTKTHVSSYIEGGVAVAEAVLLIVFSMPLWSQRVAEFPDPEDSVEVRVVAEQFAWNVHYAGADGVFGRTTPNLVDAETNPLGLDRSDPNAADDITTVSQLHLPVNKPAIIHLTSKDVIHSFTLTEMRVKQDTIPGIEIPLWFVPTKTTEEIRAEKNNPDFNYEIACAQLCGIGHYNMRGFMTVHDQEGFDQWLAQQAEAATAPADDFWNQ